MTITEGRPVPKGFSLITFPDRSIAVGFPPEPTGAFFKSFLLRQTEGSNDPHHKRHVGVDSHEQ
ncbi:MAG TPA: hypothetical protein VJ760_02040 [Nitrospiraceae bacterium]|nr:hypothetical protein [Nitrospiraceae bacterium]